MRLPEKLPLVVWLVVLPMILYCVEHSGVFASAWVCSLVVCAVFGLCVPLMVVCFSFATGTGNGKHCHRDTYCSSTSKIARHYPRRGYHLLNF
ncbi:hypothetical protein F2D81_12565 [Salmonella enterica]|nr:hypothetical protein [Salmonella enterica]EEA0372580.1 hypothetical protein [Salmonella enterica]